MNFRATSACGPKPQALVVLVAVALIVLWPTAARADPPPSRPPNHVRAALEELGLLVAGSVQYATETANSRDWDLGYDWPSLRAKLVGDAVTFDTNHFDTNMMTHPAAGTLYYIAARGNRLSVWESCFFAAATSTLWEYIGEFREQASINDLIVTPVSGMALGETLSEMGLFFARREKTSANRLFFYLLAPSHAVHDAFDGYEEGWMPSIEHRFVVSLGAGTVSAPSGQAQPEARLGWRSKITHPGETTRLRLESAWGNFGLRDASLDALAAPIGLHRPGLFVGPTVGFEYRFHHFVSAPPGESDRIAAVHAAGFTLDVEASGTLHAHASLDIRPEFAAVHSMALTDYLASGGAADSLSSVARDEGYYFAGGVQVAPVAEVGFGPWTLGGEARLETFGGFKGVDRRQTEVHDEFALRDWSALGRAYVTVSPVRGLSFAGAVERRARGGHALALERHYVETALTLSTHVEF